MPDTFLARFRGFGLRPKMCRPSANTEKHARKTSGTQGSSLFEEVSKTRKKVSSDVKNQEVDGDLFFNLPLESKDQKANSQDFFHNELIFGQFIREKIDAS